MAADHQNALSSFSLSEAEDRMEHSLQQIHAYSEDLVWQMASAEDQPTLTEGVWEEERQLNRIIEEEQAHRA